MKHITIKDVAKELNLAVSTISRAFNDKYDIKPETRELILKTAEEMGYRPNPIARKLIQQRSFNVGIVVPEFVNSFFPEVLLGAQEVLHEKGYQVLIMQSNESEETELKNVETLVDNMVDGLLVSLTSENNNNSFYEKLLKRNMPIVFFNRVAENLNTSKVVFDDYKWAFFATEHLIVQGYTDIAHIAGPKNLLLSKERSRGFNDAHRKYKLTPGHIISCGFSMREGEELAQQMVEEDTVPRAIFAASDQSAIGFMKTLKNNGYKIPEDVAIVGFSESKLAEHVCPSLTSVKQPTYEIGKAAAELLVEQINNKGIFVPQSIVLNGKLNIRESSVQITNG
ncbi:LacI family DNA-binding transcriptional regulator [Saccharicrinis aurantiacus]|uniref:LacI family DNA-binding transcriptional regulator n=1 Tax=Saccharicrinis aurantiacus TaxID=1849719 RepID=UPI0008382425|nr:LacI family DNA-binding transcriptional regulator [Saccharicrinis aurantiacus]